MQNHFESPFRGITLDKQVTNPNIVVGRFSYYSGYYHGHSFDDCARYLLQDEGVDRLVIGSFCSIGSGAAFIMGGNQGHRNDWISTFPFYWMPEVPAFAGAANGFLPAGDTVIGNDVWIGAEAIIMPGVSIGDGAVIGTRAVVTRDVAPYAIFAGNPAKIIRSRFEDRIIGLLLEMRWWDWPEDALVRAMPLLTSGDVERLYVYWNDHISST
ncbi:type B chloramphenicol O-acetyltransferase [Paracoccus litorisediminis]|uniref:Chloramphenicol acetyltransferase n=1 Tax=Paracoccus litorisediminis TaxID=2006130 RepID=A0A844HTQ7_9RHOB|nr:type B chloramphenicol O-acetyltransferase [Paracoccus litorisediminis]MTH61834.1 type B chloramphenicol O-acetyltransferase [Paracoccus litorisediminis]